MENLGKRFNPLNAAKLAWKKGSFVFVFLFMFIIYLIMLPAVRIGNIMNILTHTAVVGTIALGMGLIIISGEIDLSVGSIFAFSGGLGILTYNAILNNMISGGTASGTAHGVAMLVTFFVIVGLSSIIGFINGVMVGKMKMPAFIATLGTMLIFRSLCKFILKAIPTANGQQQQTYQIDLYYDSPFYTLGNGKLGVIPIVGIVFIVLTLIVFYLATYTKFGRKIYALGSNAKASSLAGINVPWTKAIIFTIAGVLVGLASFLHIGIYSSMDSSTAGMSYELYAIASCVIGGIAMTGGRGNIVGILFGAMSFQIIDKIISVANLNPLINDTIKGAILLLAVILQIIVVDKAAVIKWLRHIGIIFNPGKPQLLEGDLRKQLNKVRLDYDKKFEAILTNTNISEEDAKAMINDLITEREEIINQLNFEYSIKIDNAQIATKEYLRKQEIKNTVKDNNFNLKLFKAQLTKTYKETTKKNPCLVREHLELSLDLGNQYFEKAIEVENENFALTGNVDVLRDNQAHLLERDNQNGVATAQEVYETKMAVIDTNLAKITAEHEATIAALNAKWQEFIDKTHAEIEANVPNEEAQAAQNVEALEKIRVAEEATESKKAAKDAAKQEKLDVKLEEERLKKEREAFLENIYRERGMH